VRAKIKRMSPQGMDRPCGRPSAKPGFRANQK
jgi:hypothetical protein